MASGNRDNGWWIENEAGGVQRNNLISGERSTSREKAILEVEIQTIEDRFGDEPM
jgi:hypothetical protein